MRNEVEIREDILNLKNELESIISTGESEQRELAENETNRMAEIRSQIEGLENELKEVDENNTKIIETKSKKKMEKKEIRLFDLVKAIAEGNVSDEQRAYINGNSINFRSEIQATATGKGEENVPTDKAPLELAIRNASVLDKLGVRWFGNAVGNIDLPKYDGSNVYWSDSENSDAQDGAGAFTKVTLSPKRLTAYIDISRQWLSQSPEDAEAMLIADLSRAIAEKIDLTVFGAESGSTARPAGLFYSAETGTLASMTFDDVLAQENAVEEKNGTDFVFVTSPNVKYTLRGVQTASGLKMVWEAGEIDGRKTVVSNSVAKGGLLVFDPRDLACASWDKDGMVITVDPYTRAGKNEIRITVNYLFDAVLAGDRINAKIYE
jgi:HK97 family phage major capsid protein